MIRPQDIDWINPVNHNAQVEGHAYIRRNFYSLGDDFGNIPIYKKFYIQGNSNEDIVKGLLKQGYIEGATKVVFVPLIILRDDPSRY